MVDRVQVSDQQILGFIRRFLDEHGVPPSVREIQRAFPAFRSTSTIFHRLRRLEDVGDIEITELSTRNIRVVV